MPSLLLMDMANNNFTGAVPKGWGSPQSVLITEGAERLPEAQTVHDRVFLCLSFCSYFGQRPG